MQVIFATAVWGAAYPFTKHLVTEISPVTIVAVRALVGTLLLILLTGSRLRASDFEPGKLWKIFVMSILGVSAQQFIQAYALTQTSANHAGWLIAATPIMVAAVMAFLGERIGLPKVIAFALGFIGTLVVIFSRTSAAAAASPHAVRADLIFTMSCIAWAGYVVLTKKWFTDWRQTRLTTATMLVALVTVLPVWFLSGKTGELAQLTPKGWLCLTYLCVLSSALAYWFWNNAVERLGPTTSSYFIYVEPFATLLAAYALLGEPVAVTAFAGGILIMLGVYAVNMGKNSVPYRLLSRLCTHAR